MRDVPPTLLAHLQARRPILSQVLFWTTPRHRTTGAVAELALWTGANERSFVIDGVARTYHGVGAILNVPPVKSALGTDIRMQSLTLSAITPEAEDLVRAYEPRLAPAELHRAVYHPDTLQLLGIQRLFKGWIDKAPVTRPEDGGMAVIEVTLASSARALTKTLTARKSDASQRRRGDDRLRRYADVSGSVQVSWGQ